MRIEFQSTTIGVLAAGLLFTAACGGPDRDVGDQAAAGDPAGVADGERRSDQAITTEIQARYYGDDEVRGRHVDVRVNDGMVALEGTVANEATRLRAVNLAEGVDGVLGIDNRIAVDADQTAREDGRREAETRVAGKNQDGTPDGVDVSGAWITTKIQAQYFTDRDIKARNIDVTTTDTGIVTLAGQVESAEARSRATEIADSTQGVRRVDNQLRVVADAEAVVATRSDPDAARPADETGYDVDAPAGDGWVTMKIQSKYFLDGDVAGRRIDVDTQNGVVTLSGDVRTEAERRQALALARNTDGVRSVTDQLRLVPDADDTRATADRMDRSPGTVIDDTWLTTKIQSKYFLEDDVKGRDIDVTARDGVVTLTGAVASDAARQTAEAIARETEGVARVVNQLRVAPAADTSEDSNQ